MHTSNIWCMFENPIPSSGEERKAEDNDDDNNDDNDYTKHNNTIRKHICHITRDIK